MSPEQAHAAYTKAWLDKFGPMSPAEEAIPAQEWPADRDWDFSGCAVTLDGKWMMLAHPECITHRGVHIDQPFVGDCIQETPATWPSVAIDRLTHVVEHGLPDDPEDQLHAALSTARWNALSALRVEVAAARALIRGIHSTAGIPPAQEPEYRAWCRSSADVAAAEAELRHARDAAVHG